MAAVNGSDDRLIDKLVKDGMLSKNAVEALEKAFRFIFPSQGKTPCEMHLTASFRTFYMQILYANGSLRSTSTQNEIENIAD
jgi:hypothetical protein